MPTTAIAASASGDNTIVAAQGTGWGIRVIAFILSFSAAVNAKWKSGSATDLTGLYYGLSTAPTPIICDDLSTQTRGNFTTNPNEALVLNLSGAVPVGGHVVWERAPLT